MPSPIAPKRTAGYKPALAVFAAVASLWVFVLVCLGAFTTSIGAGMAFPDWPLSNGSLNPPGWLTQLPMFAEHSHRLSAGLMTILTVALACWIWLRESRGWLRKLAYFAVGLVLVQAIVGGLRVKLEPDQIVPLQTSVGRLFAMLHACLAQAFVCTLFALAVSCSRGWIERPLPVSRGLRRTGLVCCCLLFVQLAVAAVMRHSGAGLAIPSFPWSTPAGGILPDAWNFRVGIHFAHRVMAGILVIALPYFVIRVWRDRGSSLLMRTVGSAVISLLALQILLGAAIIRTFRDASVTTSHVLVGALTLASVFWLTWVAHRDRIEGHP